MKKNLIVKLLSIPLIMGCAALEGTGNAQAASSWLTNSSTSYVYKGGPFGSAESAAQEIAVQYGISRGGLEEDYLGCPNDLNLVKTGFDNQSLALMLRERSPSTGSWSACFVTLWYVTEKVCPVEQQSQWLTSGTACKDKGALACINNTYSDGANCTATCTVDPLGPYAGMCSGAGKTLGCISPSCNQTFNPIKHGTGRKYDPETVVRTSTLSLDLTYDSTPQNLIPRRIQFFGNGWAFNYGMRVWIIANNAAVVLRPDGKYFQFAPPVSGNTYVSNPDVPDALTKQVSGSTITGWQYKRAADDAIEQYDADGKLISITQRNSQTTTLSYSTAATSTSIAPRAGLMITATDHFGRALQFVYDSSARIIRATDPVGNVFNFYYNESTSVVLSGQPPGNNLTSIEFPGPHKRLFHYNEQGYTASTNLPNALTGITDENASRFAIYQYDTSGRAISSEHAGGVRHYDVAYNGDGTSTVTDPLGTSRTNDYQIVQKMPQTKSISGPACPECGPAALSYDTNGFLESRTDWNGNLTTYLRQDPNGRLDLETSRTEALNDPLVARTITTQWHPTFRLPALITEPGRTTAFAYDANGNVRTKTVTDTTTGAARTWTYDLYSPIGQVGTVDGPRTDVTDVTTYTYYANDDANLGNRGNVHTISNALSQVTTITSYDANGRPLTIVDPNGLTTTLAYHPRGWLTSRNVGGETTIYDYDFAGQLSKVTLPDASFLQYTYDAAHRLTQIQDDLDNKIVYTLDNMGNRTQEQVFDPANALAQTRTRVYDSLNRLYQDIGGTTPATQITRYGYDNQSNLTTITDPLTHVTTNGYDALNRLVQVTAPGPTVTAYGYNALDQLTSVRDPRNNATTYTVDALGNLKQQTSPDTGTTVNTYDAAGNMLTSTDAKNQITTYTYDALNRVSTLTYHDGSQVLYGYDAGANGKGRLTSITEKNPGGAVVTQTTYAYDAHGRVFTDTRTIGGVNFVTQYGYDTSGRLSTITYPSGRLVSYSFDGAGRVSAITTTPSGGSAQTVVSGVTYQPFGAVKGFTYGNGQPYSRTIDLDGRIAGFTLAGSAQTLGFDAASRIRSATYFPNPLQLLTYDYDVLDRLTFNITPSTASVFSYDDNGNRTSKTVGATNWTYAYPATSNKLASITSGATKTYTHDADGSITSDGTNTFTYDTRGRLVQAATALGTVTYGLNSLGQRYAKTVQGTTTIFHYDKQGHLIAESDPGGGTKAEYLYLGDIPVGVVK